tara:strand:- start:2199 stop:11792 length:9594 start_codon:yes stop_codon:yes gene_type:complete
MAIDKRVFTGGMDKDSDPRLIKQGDYRHAENIRNIASSDSTAGSVENIEGTKLVKYDFPEEKFHNVEILEGGFVTNPPINTIFYSQTIRISGRELQGSKYEFKIFRFNQNNNLDPVFNTSLEWTGNSDGTKAASYLYNKFNEISGVLSNNIPLVDRVSGEAITGSSSVNFTPGTSLKFGGELEITITSDVPGVDFDLDFKSDYGQEGSEFTWSSSIDDYPSEGRLHIENNGGLVIQSNADFETGDSIPNNTQDDGSPIGVTTDNNGGTEYILTISGTEPTSAQDADINNIYSYVENNGEFEVSLFAELGGEGKFNTGDPFELDTTQSNIAESLVNKFTNFESNVLVKGSPYIHTVSTVGVHNDVTLSFQSNTALKGNNNSLLVNGDSAPSSSFSLLNNYTSDDSFNNFDNSPLNNPAFSISSNVITLSSSASAGDTFFFPANIIQGNWYKIQASFTTYTSSGNSLFFKVGSSISPAITSTTFDSFIFQADSNHNSFFLEVTNNFAETDTIIIKALTISELQPNIAHLEVKIIKGFYFNLCFGSSEQEVLSALQEGRSLSMSNRPLLPGVTTSLVNKSNAEDFDYSNLLNQISQLQELNSQLENQINFKQDEIDQLTTAHQQQVSDFNAALSLSASEIASLESQITSLNNTITDLQSAQNNLNEQIVNLQNQLGTTLEIQNNDGTITTINAETYAEIQDLVSFLHESIEASAIENDLNEQQISSLQSQLDFAQSQVDAYNTELANLGLNANTFISEFNSLQNQVQELTTQNNQYQDSLTTANLLNTELQAQVDSQTQSISTLENEVTSLGATIGNQTQTLNDLQTTITEYQNGIDKLVEDLSEAVDNIQNGSFENLPVSQIGEYQVNLTNFNIKASNLQSNIMALEQDLDRALANQEDGISQEDVNNVQALLNQALDAKSTLEAEIDLLQQSVTLTDLIINGTFDSSSNWTASSPTTFAISSSAIEVLSTELKDFHTIKQTISSPQVDGSYLLNVSVTGKEEGKGAFKAEFKDVDGNVLADSVQFGFSNGDFVLPVNILGLNSLSTSSIDIIISPVSVELNGESIVPPVGTRIDNVQFFKLPNNVALSNSSYNNFVDQSINILNNFTELQQTSNDRFNEIEILTLENQSLNQSIVRYIGLANSLVSAVQSITSEHNNIISDLNFTTSASQADLDSAVSLFNQTISDLQSDKDELQSQLDEALTQIDSNTDGSTVGSNSALYRFTFNGKMPEFTDFSGIGFGNNPQDSYVNHSSYGSDPFLVFRNTNIPEFQVEDTSSVINSNNFNEDNYHLFPIYINQNFSDNNIPGFLTLPQLLINYCSDFDDGFSHGRSNQVSGNTSEPHNHIKIINTENYGEIIFIYRVLNFNNNTVFTNNSPTITQSNQPLDSTAESITTGLQVEIEIIGGPEGWEFFIYDTGSFSGQTPTVYDSNILSDSNGHIIWNLFDNYNLVGTTFADGTTNTSLQLIGQRVYSNLSSVNDQSSSLVSLAYATSTKNLAKNVLLGRTVVQPTVAVGYRCIGSYEDKPKNKLYYFIYNSPLNTKFDSILEYDLLTDSIQTVYQDGRPSSSGNNNNILNFDEDFLITGINKVDDILYFTDNLNRPRKINVELAKQNEINIDTCKYKFQDVNYKTNSSSVFIGGSTNHPFKKGDYVYTQLDNNSNNVSTSGFNGYAEVLGIVPKASSGTTFNVTNGSATVTASQEILGLLPGNFIAIQDANSFPFFYEVLSVSGTTITLVQEYGSLTNPQFASSSDNNIEVNNSAALPLTFNGVEVEGIITDCPWVGNFSALTGVMLFADPENAYSPLISFGDTIHKEKYIDAVKHQPNTRPITTSSKDSSVSTNNILDNMFQFKYRYHHVDEENTSYSGISDIKISDAFALNTNINADSYTDIDNFLKVEYEDSVSDVDTIEIVARKGNTGEFFLVDTVPNNFIRFLKKIKNEVITNDFYNYTNITSSINFFNDGTYPFVDVVDSNKLFDSVPKLAKAQTILRNNRIAYGNVLEGFDNTKIIASSSFNPIETILQTTTTDITEEISESDLGNNADPAFNPNLGGNPLLDDGFTRHFQNFFLTGLNFESGKNQKIIIDYLANLKGSKNRKVTFNLTIDITNDIDIDLIGNKVASAINNGAGTATFEGIGDGGGQVFASYNSSDSKVEITFKFNDENVGSGFTTINFSNSHDLVIKDKSKFVSGDIGVSAFKSGAYHSFGIAYFDETNRCSFVNVGPEFSETFNGTKAYNKFYTEQQGHEVAQKTELELKIFNKPPKFATHYQLYYTGNNTVDEFIQMSVVNVEAGTSNDTQMYLSLQSLKGQNYSYNQSTGSLIDYDYVEGDRVRFISYDPGTGRRRFSEYIDLQISGSEIYTSDTDDPPFTITSANSGFYIRIPNPESTSVLDEFGSTVSIAHNGFSLATSGYKNLIVEIYRPKKDLENEFNVYYEIGDKFAISNPGKTNRAHIGDTNQSSSYTLDTEINQLVSSEPATLILRDGDVYLKPRNMVTDETGSPTETFFVEDYYLNDFHNTNNYSRGRINVINLNAAERRLEASVFFSEPFSSTASINGLSSFNLANIPYFDYNKDFGSIQSLMTINDDLLIFHENKVGRVLVGADIITTAKGDNLVSLSNKIIDNYATLYSGDYGCGLQPESIVKFGNKFYFVDIKRGVVLRLSTDGLTVISESGMRDYFRDLGEMYVINDPEENSLVSFNIIGGYDPKYDEYIVTFPDVTNAITGQWAEDSSTWSTSLDTYENRNPILIFKSKTIAFNERVNKWTSFYDFYPDYYGKVNRQFIGFKDGKLYKHNTTDRVYQNKYVFQESDVDETRNLQRRYNNFYGQQYDSLIQFPFNAEPSSIKTYNALSLESDGKLFAYMFTNMGQTITGEGLKSGYDSVINTQIGFKKVDGLIVNYNPDLEGSESLIKGVNTLFYQDVKKGDFVKIYGNNKDGGYVFKYRVVKSVISNTILSLTENVDLILDNNYIEVIDFKTKESIHYSTIPYVKSQAEVNSTYSETEVFGDGSELQGVGSVDSISETTGIGEILGNFNSNVTVNSTIPSDKMTVGGKYIIGEAGDFSISDINSSYSGSNDVGVTFVCQTSPLQSNATIYETEYKLYYQKEDGTSVFLGYPIVINNSSVIFVKPNNENVYSSSSEDVGGFLFVSKDGRVEGEKMKGSYMMTTLSTRPLLTTPSKYLSRYKFNLYVANADVDKSELSNK